MLGNDSTYHGSHCVLKCRSFQCSATTLKSCEHHFRNRLPGPFFTFRKDRPNKLSHLVEQIRPPFAHGIAFDILKKRAETLRWSIPHGPRQEIPLCQVGSVWPADAVV